MEINPIYEKNLSVIKEKHPGLFRLIESIDMENEPVDVDVYQGSSGLPACFVQSRENARRVRLHDDTRQREEAVILADSMDLNPGELRFIIGMGLGYLPLEIVSRKIPLLKLFIVERSAKLFDAAMHNIDLTPLFEAEGLVLIVGELGDIKPLLYKMGSDISILLKGAEITYFESERELFPEYFARCTKTIQEQVKHLICGIQTTDKVGPRFFENSMFNFTTTMKSANMGVLDQVWSEKTVMVVGAGPSLIDNIETIKKYRNRFALVTVDSALPILLKNGVTPDLAATVDFHHISFEKYRDVIDKTSEIPIVFAAQCATMTIKPYRCPAKFFIAQPYGVYADFAEGWKYWVKWSQIEAVSHLAVLAARVSGGKNVVLVGFDLSYVGLRSYAEGTALTSNIDIEALVWVEDQKGAPVPTSVQMVGQRTLMETHINNSSAAFFNISEGVAIKGAEPVEAEAFLSGLSEIEIDPRKAVWAAWEQAPKPRQEDVVAYLKKTMKGLKTSLKFCEKGMDAAFKAKKELEKGKDAHLFKYQPLVKKAIEHYDSLISGNILLHTAVGYYEGQDINLRVDESRLTLEGEEFTGIQKIETEMAFIYRAISARKRGGDRLYDIFTNMHSRLSKELNLKAELARKNSGKTRSDILAKLGETFLAYNDFVEAEETFRMAIAENSCNSHAFTGLGKTLGRLKRHVEALECHKKAVKLDPKSQEAKRELDYELAWPERILDEASSYVRGDEVSSSGQGQENWAVRLCDEILGIYPDNERAAEIRAMAQERLGQSRSQQDLFLPYMMVGCDRALEMLEPMIAEQPDLAKRALSLLRKQYPEHPGVLEAYGLMFLADGDIQKAKNFLVQARSLDPGSYSTRVHLARILASENNFDEALMYLQQAYDLAPENIAPFFIESIGDLLFEQNRFEEALKNYESFFIKFPERRDILQRIGNCYAKMGKMEAAKLAWDSINKI